MKTPFSPGPLSPSGWDEPSQPPSKRMVTTTTCLCGLLRTTAPGLLLLLRHAPPTLRATWLLSAATTLHLPGFLADLFSLGDISDVSSSQLWPVLVCLGALLALGVTSFSYAVHNGSALEAYIWLAATVPLILGIQWFMFSRASSSSRASRAVGFIRRGANTDTVDPSASTGSIEAGEDAAPPRPRLGSIPAAQRRASSTLPIPPPSPAAWVISTLGFVVFALAALTFIDGDASANAAGALSAVSFALFGEGLRACLAVTTTKPLVLAMPCFILATVITGVAAIVGAPGSEGVTASGKDSQALFGWLFNATRFVYTSLAGLGFGLVGVTIFAQQLASEVAPSGSALRLTVLLEPVLAVLFAWVVADQPSLKTTTLVTAAVVLLGTQVVAFLTGKNATHTPVLRQGSLMNLADLAAKAPANAKTEGLISAFMGKAQRRASINSVSSLQEVSVSGHGGPASVVSSVAHGRPETDSHPPRLSRGRSSYLSLRHLDTSFEDPMARVRTLKADTLPAQQRQAVLQVLEKHGVKTREDMVKTQLPAELISIACALLDDPVGTAKKPFRATTPTNAPLQGRHSVMSYASSSYDGRASTALGPPTDAIDFSTRPESIHVLQGEELSQVLKLLDHHCINNQKELQESDLADDVKAYLNKLVPSTDPLQALSAAGVPRRVPLRRRSSVGKLPALANRRASASSMDLEGVADELQDTSHSSMVGVSADKSPAATKMTKNGKRKNLDRLKIKSQVIPGAITTPTPAISDLPGLPKFNFADSPTERKSPFDAGVGLRPQRSSTDHDEEHEEDPWASPKASEARNRRQSHMSITDDGDEVIDPSVINREKKRRPSRKLRRPSLVGGSRRPSSSLRIESMTAADLAEPPALSASTPTAVANPGPLRLKPIRGTPPLKAIASPLMTKSPLPSPVPSMLGDRQRVFFNKPDDGDGDVDGSSSSSSESGSEDEATSRPLQLLPKTAAPSAAAASPSTSPVPAVVMQPRPDSAAPPGLATGDEKKRKQKQKLKKKVHRKSAKQARPTRSLPTASVPTGEEAGDVFEV